MKHSLFLKIKQTKLLLMHPEKKAVVQIYILCGFLYFSRITPKQYMVDTNSSPEEHVFF